MKAMKLHAQIERPYRMKNRIKRVKQRIVLMLMLVCLMSWDTLPIQSSGQAAQAATSASLTKLPNQSDSRVVGNSMIAFVSAQENHSEIYTMNADGGDRRRLTSGPRDLAPARSPDGAQIAFVRTDSSGQRSEIFVMNADGSNQRRLTHSAEMDNSPVWSPDGTKIAFSRINSFRISLVVMNADGSDQRNFGQAFSPIAWSPDGSKLAVSSYDQIGLYVINADGSNLTPITHPAVNGAFDIEFDTNPSWSPDGSKITFSRFVGCNIELVDCRGGQIWVVNADGSNLTKLIDISMGAEAPTWSPDGTKIIFSNGDLLVMNADGSGITNITNTINEREFSPSWQPLSLTSCADSISATSQSFEANGGTGSVDVTAGGECNWTAASNVSWISVASGSNGSGNGTVSYSVAANNSTAPRTGVIRVANRNFIVTQTGVPVRINSVTVSGKKLFIFGENFDPGAVILLDGKEQATRNDDQNPKTRLIGKKAGKKVRPGDRLQVRNPNGALSQEFTF